MVMLNRDDQDVLAYVRTAPTGSQAVVVAMNMSSSPKTISLDPSEAHVKGTRAHTLAASTPFLQGVTSLHSVTLPRTRPA